MNVELIKATIDDAQLLWEMQIKAFQKLLDKYQDYETSPGNEPLSKTVNRINQQDSYYYFICMDNIKVGAVRVIDSHSEMCKRISPIFVLPEYQNKGIAQKALTLCEQIHGTHHWELDTILQEKGNCYLYEKFGYRQTGKTEKVNDKLTLVFYEKD